MHELFKEQIIITKVYSLIKIELKRILVLTLQDWSVVIVLVQKLKKKKLWAPSKRPKSAPEPSDSSPLGCVAVTLTDLRVEIKGADASGVL